MSLGPIENLIDRDSHRRGTDAWVIVGPVGSGKRGTATFELENVASHQTEISLTLTNPLASMKGTIPLDQVTFTPNPISLSQQGAVEVKVAVGVPPSTPPGRYLGIVRSDEVADLTVILGVDVA